MDSLPGFLADCCLLQPSAWTLTEQLRAEYERWARENGEGTVDGSRFRNGLRRHGGVAERRHAGPGMARHWPVEPRRGRGAVTVGAGQTRKVPLSDSHGGLYTKRRHGASRRHGR